VVCRTVRDKRDLLRVARTTSGEIRYDASGRLNGRGAYVCRDATCIDRGIARGILGRALESSIPPALSSDLLAGAGIETESPPQIPGGSIGQE
jgi:uncharacterized protein